MLMVNQLIGFGAGGRDLVQTIIALGTGTNIGNMSGGGGLAAAEDGNTNKGFGACSNSTPIAAGTWGKDWGSGNTKVISGFAVWGGNNCGYDATGPNHALTITLKGSTDNFVSSNVTLGSISFTDTSVTDTRSKLTGITATTGYRYHRLEITRDDSLNTEPCFAQVRLYEDI